MGRGGLEEVIERRRRLREEAINRARAFAECARGKLGRLTAIVFGSYARGDFNVWSDVDLLLVVDRPLPPSPLKRLGMIEECLRVASDVEPLVLTASELKERLGKGDPAVVEAVGEGVIVLDDLGLGGGG